MSIRSELKTGAVSLHSDIGGEGDVPVVMLHGLFGSTSNLMGVARSLEADFRVIRFDLRNHGKSAHSEVMDIPSMAGDVAEAMQQLGLSQAYVLGHSLGGKVAMELAATQGERVKGLVVADIAPVAYGRGHDAILDGLLALDLQALKNREQADTQLKSAVPELAVRQFLLKNLARDGQSGWKWRMNLAAIAASYDRLRAAPNSAVYAGPTLFIRGEKSRYIIDENRVPIMRQFPDARLETIAGAGHWLHAERPEEFNALVRGFLASCEDGTH